ncbi:MAG: hypothetical protein D6710_05620 [Nitrospirae bacterium]|nr:MAG: hypothetical protein D6710_05620 [Nitrospirota bacterium]
MLTISKGRIIFYRLFDIASEIDLHYIERVAAEGAKRLKLSKRPYMKALQFTNPPVSLEMSSYEKEFMGSIMRVDVLSKLYDFGVLSIAFSVNLPEGTSFKMLEQIASYIDTNMPFDERAYQIAEDIIKTFTDALEEPEIKRDFYEDYTVYFIEKLSKPISSEEFLSLYNPAPLLLNETKPLSDYTVQETIKFRFSYYPDDLVIIHLDNAFIIEPSGISDLPDVLEFANAQILELRYYDTTLDNELNLIYQELSERASPSIFRLKEYERLARRLTQTVTDLTEVTERVNNALKVTEDVYYAKIYRTAMTLLRSKDWEDSIENKLQVIINTYRMLYDEISTKREQLLELGIFLLIVIEIFLAVVGFW